MEEGEGDENGSNTSEDGESSAEGSKASDKIVAAENLETGHEDAGPSPENTDVLGKPKLDSFDDELFIRLQAEAREAQLQSKSEQDADQFRSQFILEQIEDMKNRPVKVKAYTPQKCHESSCNQRPCTSQDETDPKDSLYCREHVCRVPGCVRLRVKTLDTRGLGPVESLILEGECSEHWVIPDVARWEGLTNTRDEDRGIPADHVTVETDPEGKGKEVAHQESSELAGVALGQYSTQNDIGIIGLGLGASSLGSPRQIYDPQNFQARTDFSNKLRQVIDQQNKLDEIQTQAMIKGIDREFWNPISEMSHRDAVGLGYTSDPGDVLEKDPSPLNEDEDINAGVPAHADGSIPSLDSLPREAEDSDSFAATSTEGRITPDAETQGTKERTRVSRVSTAEEEEVRRLMEEMRIKYWVQRSGLEDSKARMRELEGRRSRGDGKEDEELRLMIFEVRAEIFTMHLKLSAMRDRLIEYQKKFLGVSVDDFVED